MTTNPVTGVRTVYFLDGPLEGQSIATRLDWLSDGRYTCKVPAGPLIPAKARPTGRVPMDVKQLVLTYKMVDEKLGHMKLEKIS